MVVVLVAVFVPPVPVFFLLSFVSLLQVPVLAVGVVLPLVVVDDLAIDGMVVVVVRVIVARVNGAADRKHGTCHGGRKEAGTSLAGEKFPESHKFPLF
jgi:hypothetical protein